MARFTAPHFGGALPKTHLRKISSRICENALTQSTDLNPPRLKFWPLLEADTIVDFPFARHIHSVSNSVCE